MKALIYKDFTASKKALALLAALIFAVSAYNLIQGNVIAIPMMFILIPLIMLGMSFGNDAESNVDQYIIAGPVSRETIVLSRYVQVWAIAAVSAVLALTVSFLPEAELYNIPWYLMVPAALLLATLIAVIQLPLMYKFGAEKSKIVFFVLYFAVFAALSYFGDNKDFLLNLHVKVPNLALTGIILLAVTVAINWLSYAVSVNIYKNKEF